MSSIARALMWISSTAATHAVGIGESMPRVCIHYDCLPATRTCFDFWQSSTQPRLASMMAGLGQIANCFLAVGGKHVKGHAGQPWSEMADVFAKAVCDGRIAPVANAAEALRGVAAPIRLWAIGSAPSADWAFLHAVAEQYPPVSGDGRMFADISQLWRRPVVEPQEIAARIGGL
jgi:hypothetical protein